MDVVKAVETYVNKMVQTPNAIKVLLLDSDTVSRLAQLGVEHVKLNATGRHPSFLWHRPKVPCCPSKST